MLNIALRRIRFDVAFKIKLSRVLLWPDGNVLEL